jgi:hypothetical protein
VARSGETLLGARALGIGAWALWDATRDPAPLRARLGADDTGEGFGPGYSTTPGVALNDRQAAFAQALSDATGLFFNVRSGTRTAVEQASAMLKKLRLGEDLTKLYGEKARELLALPQDARTWGAKIAEMQRKGILFSRHMVGDAFDIDYAGLSDEDVDALIAAAREMGATTLHEGTPPHLHIEAVPDLEAA